MLGSDRSYVHVSGCNSRVLREVVGSTLASRGSNIFFAHFGNCHNPLFSCPNVHLERPVNPTLHHIPFSLWQPILPLTKSFPHRCLRVFLLVYLALILLVTVKDSIPMLPLIPRYVHTHLLPILFPTVLPTATSAPTCYTLVVSPPSQSQVYHRIFVPTRLFPGSAPLPPNLKTSRLLVPCSTGETATF